MEENTMEETQVAQILHEIARQQVPDDVDLWPAIRAQVQPRRPLSLWARLRPTTRLGWISLALVLSLAWGAVAYAVAPVMDRLFQQETGLQHVEQAGLVRELDLSQTVEGVTVTLERAYADANRVVVGFTVSGPDGQRYDPYRVTLVGTDGAALPLATGMGMTGSSDVLGADLPPGDGAHVLSFDAAAVEGEPAELDLRLVVELERVTLPPDATGPFLTSARPPANTPDSAVVVDLEPLPTPDEGAIVGPFIFDFSLPFDPGHTVEVRQTAEAAGVAVRLERVLITPSETRAFLCFEPPVGEGTVWTLLAALDVGDGQDLFGGVVVPIGEMGREECHRVIYPYGLADRSGLWTLTVTELVGTDLTKRPSEDIRLPGPWVFRFPVP
ncbi:MAG TPA: DUF4179 domain-containing protein [Anaerolineae bacterium]|nr:DUF4179 domain-containing protein [Anaerolineae bacterium]